LSHNDASHVLPSAGCGELLHHRWSGGARGINFEANEARSRAGEDPAVERYPETTTGNPEFDRRFILAAAPGLGAQAVTPELQRLIMARDDWAFAGHDSWLACVTRDPFESSDDVQQLLAAVIASVAALPASIVPSEFDRSADDLLAGAEQLSSPEQVVAYLGQLSPEDRQRLAQSDTPLAALADVTSWDEVIARLQSLDVAQRMQLLAMFKRARSG
jgi:hypothetical protein